MKTQFVPVVLPCACLYLAVIAVLIAVMADNDQAAYRFHDLMKWLRYLTSALSMYVFITLISSWTRIEGDEIVVNRNHIVSINEVAQAVIGCMLMLLYYKVARAFYELEKIGSRLAV